MRTYSSFMATVPLSSRHPYSAAASWRMASNAACGVVAVAVR
ncbi:hypothetical protein ACFQZC_38620 [Streptacidiphilus monticola]